MNKMTWTALIWILLLATPFTLAALAGIAFLTEYSAEIYHSLQMGQQGLHPGQNWIVEAAERLPELAGMIIGQVVILAILLIARKENQAEKNLP